MPEIKVLNTTTKVTTSNGLLSVFTQYIENVSGSIIAFITDTVSAIEGIYFKECQLGYTKDGYQDVSFYINEMGELVVISDNPERFAIDEDGNLTITE